MIIMENKESFAVRAGEFLRQQGFYIVLALCLLIVGVAIALTALPREQAQVPETTPQQQVSVESNASQDESLAAKTTPVPTAVPTAQPTATPMPAATPAPTAAAASSAVKPTVKGQAPVDGEIIWDYAMDQLLYSVTLDQWTTHAGVDIACDIGTPVEAVLAGTVRSIYEDDALGMVVTIEHTNDRTSLYANLDMEVAVSEGAKVNAGDVIGKVGDTAMSECGSLPHLHFGFFQGGKPANPVEHITLPH